MAILRSITSHVQKLFPLQHASTSQAPHYRKLIRRPGFQIAGFLLLMGIIGLAVGVPAGEAHTSSDLNAATSDLTLTPSVNDSTDSSAAASPQSASGSSSPSTSVDTSVSSSSTNGSSSTSTKVSVNGHAINVPANGTTQQTIQNGDSTTTVTVSNDQSGSGNSASVSATTNPDNVMQGPDYGL